MPFVKKSKATRDSEKLSGEQRGKKLSELEGDYKKYWDARSKLLEAETDETKSSTSSSTTKRFIYRRLLNRKFVFYNCKLD